MSEVKREKWADIAEEMKSYIEYGDGVFLDMRGADVARFVVRIDAAVADLRDENARLHEVAVGLQRSRAAIKRESEPVTNLNRLGNVAKLREAAENAIAVIDKCSSCRHVNTDYCDTCDNVGSRWYDDLKAALAAPPRNCDVGTAEEQIHGFYNFCRVLSKGVSCHGCQFFETNYGDDHCAILWGQLPYEAAQEGGDHADET